VERADPVPRHTTRPYETTWEDWLLGGGAAGSFPDPGLPLEVEIGPGEDDFLLESARAHPGRNWLGIEYSHKRVERYVRRVRRLAPEVQNLRLIWRPASDLVGEFLSPARVRAYHVHFPDPWPKKHHGRYRLLTPAFLRDLQESLVRGGTIDVFTDERPYVEEMLAAFAEAPLLENVLPPPGFATPGPSERLTVFEERWRGMGRAIHHVRFRRRAEPPPA
jgi:tRNA (guanine-N7-)-methyltransferase